MSATIVAVVLSSTAAAQGQAPRPVVPAASALATAVNAAHAPVIDGSMDDDVWRSAPEIAGFRVFDPTEDGDPAFRTEARVAYDARNLYVFVRAYDAHPDSIVSLLSRRDVRTSSDQIKVMVDSYFDHRTGYEFGVNPAGVKRDYYTYDDGREDISWDAVWDVATAVDSLGWTAEFRIPLSQVRYEASDENSFGIMIMRDVARTNERSSWPVYRRSRTGLASQFARVGGFRGLGSPRRIELLPYVVTRNVLQGDGRAQQQTVGGDAKVGIGSNLTLTAAVNPDFGQVEADPAVLNLTAFEVSFAELRPFFVEGSGAFGRDQTIFYSRRIGRAPQLSGFADANADIPASTPIAAATKLTGRTAGGFTVGALAAYTAVQRAGTVTIEPGTLYSLARVAKDFRRGQSGISATATLVDRNLDAGSENILRGSAYVAGVNGRHRFHEGNYQVEASVTGSHVDGTAAAIARTQRNSVHYFHRPDSPLTYDPALTTLSGANTTLGAGKVGGAFQYYGTYQRITPGFESNDLGFLSRADYQSAFVQAGWTSTKPHAFWRNAKLEVQAGSDYTADGLAIGNFLQLQGYTQFKNSSNLQITTWTDYFAPAFCDRCARGGPALRLSPDYNVLVNLQGDTRKKVVPYVAAIYTIADEGRSQLWRVRPLVDVRNGSRLSWQFGARYQKNNDNTQWVANAGAIGADSTHYIFGHLNQDLLSFSARLNYTVTPTLSLQYYAEPFVSTGHYTGLRDMKDGRATDYDARFKPTTATIGSPDFNVKEFNSNAVVRWEYRPGSAVYLVWQQGRSQSDRDYGNFSAGRDYENLFRTRPDNTFLIKASYWFGL